jgi:hypothetical protein
MATKKSTTPNIVDEITAFMKRFIVFSEDAHADVLALWILHTHAFEGSYATPYIYVNSAEPQSGKTRVLEVCELLARSPQKAANMTVSALFSRMQSSQPTVFIDEVDTIFAGAANDELRGVLNSGYKRGGVVSRFVGEKDDDGNRVVTDFHTFCPKMLVGIDNAAMPDTLRDRCIDFKLKRKKAGAEVERFVPRKVEPQADELRDKIAAWARENMDRVLDAPEPKPIDGISDRKFEIAEPLLMLAHVARREAVARKALTAMLAGEAPKLSIGIRALTDARQIMDDAQTDRVSSAVLAKRIDVSQKRLGVILSAYGITPSVIRFSSNERARGYHRADFADAWERYCD